MEVAPNIRSDKIHVGSRSYRQVHAEVSYPLFSYMIGIVLYGGRNILSLGPL